MAVVSTSSNYALHVEERWDAEYFHPQYQAIAAALGKLPTTPLGNLLKLSCSAFYPAATKLYTNDGIPFVRCVDVNPYPVLRASQPFERIPAWFVDAHKTIKTAGPGDLIISKVGSPCYTSIIDDDLTRVALTRTVLLARQWKSVDVDAAYLVAFLRSKYGFDQLLRAREQQIQFQLTLERVRRISVYVAARPEQTAIGDLVRSYGRTLEASVVAFRRSLDTYEHAVFRSGLPTRLSNSDNSVSLYEMERANRWDAQCFDPNLLAYEAALASFPNTVPLRDLVKRPIKGRQQDELGYDGDIPYASIKHISDMEVVTTSLGSRLAAGAKIARTSDLLLAITGATIGKIGIVNRNDALAFSGDLLALRANGKADPLYLLVALMHASGQAQLHRWVTGSTNGHLAPRDVLRTLVPRLGPLEDSIADQVRKSLDLRIAAEGAIASAKSAVEELIEKEVNTTAA